MCEYASVFLGYGCSIQLNSVHRDLLLQWWCYLCMCMLLCEDGRVQIQSLKVVGRMKRDVNYDKIVSRSGVKHLTLGDDTEVYSLKQS